MSALIIPTEVKEFIKNTHNSTQPFIKEEGFEYIQLNSSNEVDSLENKEDYIIEEIKEDLLIQILKINEQDKTLEVFQTLEIYKQDFHDLYYLLNSFSDIDYQPLYIVVMGYGIENMLITLISDKNGIKNRILYSSNKLPLLKLLKEQGKVKDVVITEVEELKTIDLEEEFEEDTHKDAEEIKEIENKQKYKDLVYKNQNYKTIGTIIPGSDYELGEDDITLVENFLENTEDQVLLMELNESELGSLKINALSKSDLSENYDIGYKIESSGDEDNKYSFEIYMNEKKMISPKWRMLYSLNNLKVLEFWTNYFSKNNKILSN
ncbi:hypothetical protein HANVADRAFT_53553 [Hanseniaspora valbyensis NRRL Y-1626]|uniref:ADF-H domain-containing protein n=1 Tax=Hanseniaspora valbyensis NRRL Y-1626 TaxID=766949 RepID=A0A1B7TB35_9ASCO|nr:hypothetical protein HANVADRAFT_53553 [Hanseniaspora valbyensis NRRL Y-1626]